MIKPELMEYVEELKAYITADGGIDVFELKETYYHDNPEKAGKKLKLDHYYIKTKTAENTISPTRRKTLSNFVKAARR